MSVEETILTYIEAWATADEERRAALLEQCWTDDGVYTDPRSRGEGRKGLSAIITGFQQQRPGARIPITSGVDHHHEFVRFRWALVGTDGAVLSEGFDVGGLTGDNRLRWITGFFGPFPPVPETWPARLVGGNTHPERG